MEKATEKETVLVTGINGYVGSWVAYKLLEGNEYSVAGTVRDPSNQEKLNPLKEGLGDEKYSQISFYAADMMNADSVKKAVEDSKCKYIIHVASPFPFAQPKDENELIEPAVTGTKTIMEAAFDNGVKRVVITSSCVAIESFTRDTETAASEDSWHDYETTPTNAYYKSKLFAEKAAWNFYDNLNEEDKKNFGLCTINPGFILGPLLVKNGGTSQDLITGIFDGRFSQMPDMYTSCVDIRDVADAHIRALTCEPGRRFPLAEGNYSFEEITGVLQEKYNKEGFNIKFSNPPKTLLWLMSFLSNDADYYYRRWGARCVIDNSVTKEILKIDFIPLKTSLIEMSESLFTLGYIKKPDAN